MKLEAVRSSEMLINIYQTTWCHIQKVEFIIATAMRISDLAYPHFRLSLLPFYHNPDRQGLYTALSSYECDIYYCERL
jgi:hypothetical protein